MPAPVSRGCFQLGPVAECRFLGDDGIRQQQGVLGAQRGLPGQREQQQPVHGIGFSVKRGEIETHTAWRIVFFLFEIKRIKMTKRLLMILIGNNTRTQAGRT